MPKRGINTHENEVMRAFKTVNDSYIEPISFIVPRRAEVFQDDIYPPVFGSNPAMSSKEWFDGKEGFPAKIDLASVYAGEGPTEIPAGNKPVLKDSTPLQPPALVKKDAEPLKKEVEPVKQANQPSPALRPLPSMKEQAGSIANLASKFADKDDDNSEGNGDEDASSFEEVSKPVDRSERFVPKAEDHSETRGHIKALSITPGPSSLSATPLSRPTVDTVPAQTKVCKSTPLFLSYFVANDWLASRASCYCCPTLILIHFHKSTNTLLSPRYQISSRRTNPNHECTNRQDCPALRRSGYLEKYSERAAE